MTFDEHLDAWQDYTGSPWGRIRYAVVAHALAREVERLGTGPLRVLDVGGGDGLDVLPLAQAGHAVTILDTSASMLAAADNSAARRGAALETRLGGIDQLVHLGEFDLVLCHFLLQYRPPGTADLAALVQAVRPGGLLSSTRATAAGSPTTCSPTRMPSGTRRTSSQCSSSSSRCATGSRTEGSGCSGSSWRSEREYPLPRGRKCHTIDH